MKHKLLSLGSSTPWISETTPMSCNQQIASWLFDHNSLTEKLEKQRGCFSVSIKQQQTVPPNELLSGYFNNEKQIFVREVFLRCQGENVVFAQTEIPYSTLTQAQIKLAQLGEQSLGKTLFQDPTMLRGQIEVTQFSPNSICHQLCAQIDQPTELRLWARRSLFYLNNKPLLVSELFLPASGIYTK